MYARRRGYAPLAQLRAALSSLFGGACAQRRHGTAGRDRRIGGSHARARIGCLADQPRQVVRGAVGDLGERACVARLFVEPARERAACEVPAHVGYAPRVRQEGVAMRTDDARALVRGPVTGGELVPPPAEVAPRGVALGAVERGSS